MRAEQEDRKRRTLAYQYARARQGRAKAIAASDHERADAYLGDMRTARAFRRLYVGIQGDLFTNRETARNLFGQVVSFRNHGGG